MPVLNKVTQRYKKCGSKYCKKVCADIMCLFFRDINTTIKNELNSQLITNILQKSTHSMQIAG